MAARPSRGRRAGTRSGVTPRRVASRAWKRSRPSLDWGDELSRPLLWVAKAWAIGAVSMVVVLAAARPVHHVGHGSSGASPATISRAAKAFRRGRSLGVLLLSVMIDVRLGVLFSYQSNDQFSALQAAFEGEGSAKDAAIKQLLAGDADLRRPGRHRHRPQSARHLPDAAVHHPVAGVAHAPAHR